MVLASSTAAIERFEMRPLLGSALPDVARFLHRWHASGEPGPSLPLPVRDDSLSTERRLQWLLLENPLTRGADQHGLCIRNASGALVGVLLSFPASFLGGDERLLGLGSGSFFVEPRARAAGFFLFKRYLGHPGYAFFFSTTCNANSSALWKALGASAAPHSDTEYMLPLRLEVMLPAFLTKRTSSPRAAAIARVFGRCADPVRQLLTRKSGELTLEPCGDWEKLAGLFRRHRPAQWITTDRSAPYLRWRYGPNSHNHPFEICVFRDKRGNEGWFSLGHIIRGRHGQIRGCVLLDAVWPREKIGFREILAAILQLVASKADAVFFQPRPGVDHAEYSRWIIPCRLEAPKIFAITRKGGAPLAVSSLDLVPADGDGAF